MLRWFGRKLDMLTAAILAAVIGLAASQLQAFAHQYIQRLGGHLDEARRTERAVSGGEAYRHLAAADRDRLARQSRTRVAEIEKAYHAIRDAVPLMKPLVLARRLDPEIAMRVGEDFQPALPLDPASLVYGAAGMVLALLLHDLAKAPFAMLMRRRRRSRAPLRTRAKSRGREHVGTP